jgi:cell wall-associated NlpC family hydrolase
MTILLRHIVIALLLTLLGGLGNPDVYGGVKKLHRSKRHHAKLRTIRPAPAVIDTTGIDTADLVSQNIVREINRWSRVRYRMGGITHKGTDCSGFVVKVFQNSLTLQLPRTSREQAKVGERIDRDELQFGDLVFFYKGVKKKAKRISHVGIYIGDGNFVHSSRHKGVGVDALSERYYSQRYALARRVADLTSYRGDGSSSIIVE